MKLRYPLTALVAFLSIGISHAQDTKKPNIIFILADDLGIMDIRAFATHFTGTPSEELYYETPHLDQLAREGMAFSQSYANQLCSPTRAAVLTGRIASRLGVTTATPNTKTYYNQGLKTPAGCRPHDAYDHKDRIQFPMAWLNGHSNTGIDPSVPGLARVLKTHDAAFLGKWHLGGHGAAQLQPSAHGFRELACLDSGASSYFKWQASWNRKKPRFPTMPGEFRAGRSGDKPHAKYLIDDLSNRACDFIKERANETKPFFLYYCPFAVHTPLQAPAEDIKYFSAKKQRGKFGHNNATYASMLKHLDASIGNIRKTLKDTGLDQNTLIIFTSDNGGVEYTQPAATDNQPFVGGKATLYEGGIRVPTIVHWPKNVPAGTWSKEVIDATDFLPTLTDLTGNTTPKDIDGVSAADLFKNKGAKRAPRSLYWHYPFNVIVKHPIRGTPLSPHSAIRVGAHKLIWDWHGKLELYDIENDPFEKNELSKNQPKLTAKLHQQLKSWLKENVSEVYFPKPNPEFDPADPRLTIPFTNLGY